MVLSLDIANMSNAILILISFVEVPSFLKVDPSYLKEYFLKVLTGHHDVNGGVLVGTVDKYFAFLGADFPPTSSCLFFQFGSEVLEFILATFHEINIVRKTKITNWPSTNRYGGVHVLKGLLHDVLEEYVEENRRECAPLTISYSCLENVSKLVI